MLSRVALESRAQATWAYRERIEREASVLFGEQAERLRSLRLPAAIVDLAARASEDELDHAERCRLIVDRLNGNARLDTSEAHPAPIGPSGLDKRRRALYVSVAIGCVTETLSTALLIHLRERATHPLVRDTVRKILRDEVQHSRLGWAHLAYEAERDDVTWLAPHIGPMLSAAIDEERYETSNESLETFGILDRDLVECSVAQTIDTVIRPGLAGFGIRPQSRLLVDTGHYLV